MSNMNVIANRIANRLHGKDGDYLIVGIDPATMTIIITILKIALQLFRQWKPDWFINWQIKRVVKRQTKGTTLALRRDELKELVLQELHGS